MTSRDVIGELLLSVEKPEAETVVLLSEARVVHSNSQASYYMVWGGIKGHWELVVLLRILR